MALLVMAACVARDPLQDPLALALQDGNCLQEEDLRGQHAHRLHFDCIAQCMSEDRSKRECSEGTATYI